MSTIVTTANPPPVPLFQRGKPHRAMIEALDLAAAMPFFPSSAEMWVMLSLLKEGAGKFTVAISKCNCPECRVSR